MSFLDPFAAAITLIAIIANLFLIVFLILNFKKNKANVSFLIVLFFTLIWFCIELFMRLTSNEPLVLTMIRTLNFDMVMLSLAVLYFSISVSKESINIKVMSLLLAIGGIIGFSAILTDKITAGVLKTSWGYTYLTGEYHVFFVSFLVLCYLLSLAHLIAGYIDAKPGAKKNVLKGILIGVSFPIIIGVPQEQILPHFGIVIFPLGSITVMIAVIFITNVLLKYDL